MPTRRRWMLAGVAAIAVAGVGLLVAMFAARRSDLEQHGLLLQSALVPRHSLPSGEAPVTQLPGIDARAERGGVVVTLRNETPNRQVVISVRDRLVVTYEVGLAGEVVREVRLPARTLAPGEATAAIFIPLDEDRSGPVKVGFEMREDGLTARTSETIP